MRLIVEESQIFQAHGNQLYKISAYRSSTKYFQNYEINKRLNKCTLILLTEFFQMSPLSNKATYTSC